MQKESVCVCVCARVWFMANVTDYVGMMFADTSDTLSVLFSLRFPSRFYTSSLSLGCCFSFRHSGLKVIKEENIFYRSFIIISTLRWHILRF